MSDHTEDSLQTDALEAEVAELLDEVEKAHPEVFDLLTPESVTPAATFLVSEDAPNKTMISVGAGGYALVKIVETVISVPDEIVAN